METFSFLMPGTRMSKVRSYNNSINRRRPLIEIFAAMLDAGNQVMASRGSTQISPAKGVVSNNLEVADAVIGRGGWIELSDYAGSATVKGGLPASSATERQHRLSWRPRRRLDGVGEPHRCRSRDVRQERPR
jgi:hypothetical protein